jgi:hypothetical protein
MAAGPAEKLKTRIVKSWKRARKRKIAQKSAKVAAAKASHCNTGHANSTTWIRWHELAEANYHGESAGISRHKRKWPSARVRKRPLSHCHRQPAKPGALYNLPGAPIRQRVARCQRSLSTGITWPA